VAIKELKIQIVATSEKLVRATKKAEVQLKKLGRTATATGGKIKKAFSGLGSMILSGPLAALLSLTAVIGGVTKAIGAFARQQAAVNRLSASIRNQSGDVKTLGAEYQKTATAIQRLTGVGDESSLETMAQGLNLGVATDEIEAMTVAAVGLSRKIGTDVKTAMMLLARGAKGQMTMFTRYGITLDQTKSKQEQFAQVLKFANDGFSLAQAELDDLSGKWGALKGAVGDASEMFGEAITKQTGLQDAIEGTTGVLEDLMDAFNKEDSAPKWAERTIGYFKLVGKSFDFITSPLDKVADAFKGAASSVDTFWKAINSGSSFLDSLNQAANGVTPSAEGGAESDTRLKQYRERIAKLQGTDFTVIGGEDKSNEKKTGLPSYLTSSYDQRMDQQFEDRANAQKKEDEKWAKLQSTRMDGFFKEFERYKGRIKSAGDAQSLLNEATENLAESQTRAAIIGEEAASREWKSRKDLKEKEEKEKEREQKEKERAGYTRSITLGDLYGKKSNKIKFNRLGARGPGDGFRTTEKDPVRRMGGTSSMKKRSMDRLNSLKPAQDGFAGMLMDKDSKDSRRLKSIADTNKIIADNSKGPR
jgi:hypothetical protein